MNVYIIRHGQTEWNKAERWQGNMDIPLDETGIRQSEMVAEKLSGYSIGRIYSSPLKRASETAHIIQKKIKAEIVSFDALKEICMGEWSGLTLAEMEEKYGDLYLEWNTSDAARIGYGVENYQDLQSRAFDALNEICNKESESILIVAHGTWLRALMCRLLYVPLCHRNSFEIDNTGVNIIEYDKDSRKFKVVTLNACF